MHPLAQRIETLDSSDRAFVLKFIEFLEWKRHERPLIVTQESLVRAKAMARRLRAVREALGRTELEAANAAGVALVSYRRYEADGHGPRRWPSHKCEDYCDAWNVSLDWLVRGEGTMFREGGPPKLKPAETEPPAQPPRRRSTEPASTKKAETNLLDFSNFRRYRQTD